VWCLLSFGYRNVFDAKSIRLSLNAFFDRCLGIIATFDYSTIQHVSIDENTVVNDLTQQASGFRSNRGKLYVLQKPDVPVCHSGCSGFQPMHNAKICSAEPSSAKTGGSDISRGSDDLDETVTAEPED